MIGWEDVYKVVVVMVPLYVALGLGYGSVRWWRMFKPDQCDAINRFNCYFVMPLFTFQFTIGVDPYHMNYRFLAGDVVAKAMVGVALVLWVKLWRKGNLPWATTTFSMSSFNNTLVVGVPLLRAMYGVEGEDLVVQSSVIQALIWFPILIFLLEFNRTRAFLDHDKVSVKEINAEPIHDISIEIEPISGVGGGTINDSSTTKHVDHHKPQDDDHHDDREINSTGNIEINAPTKMGSSIRLAISMSPSSSNFGSTMKKALVKLAKNPNSYACALGFIWALLAKRWHFGMPSIVEGSIQIMAKGGSGVAMFTMGLFMALQEKMIACGMRLTLYGMILRFVAGPLTTAVGSLALGLRSKVLCIAIVQAALPQAIASFVYAQEYGLHPNVLSTAVIFGTIVSLPLLIVYYIVLDVIH